MRRREPERRESAERPAAPRRIWNSLAGMRHFGGTDAQGHIVIGGPGRQLLDAARNAWCRDRGCWRPGTKTCTQVYGRPCAARKADD